MPVADIRPTLLPTSLETESHAGFTYHSTASWCRCSRWSSNGQQVYFEHHILLWKHTQVQIGL